MADAEKGRGKEFGRETAREGDKKGGAEGVSFPNLALPESPSSFLLNDSKGAKKPIVRGHGIKYRSIFFRVKVIFYLC